MCNINHNITVVTILVAVLTLAACAAPAPPLPKREIPHSNGDWAEKLRQQYADDHVAAGAPMSGTNSPTSTAPAMPPWVALVGIGLTLLCGWGVRKREGLLLTLPGLAVGLVLIGLVLQPTFMWPPFAHPWWKVLHVLEALGLLLLWSAFKGLPLLKKIEFDDAILCVGVFVFIGLAALLRALGWEHSFLASTYWWTLAFVWIWSLAEAIWTGLATRPEWKGFLLTIGWGALIFFS